MTDNAYSDQKHKNFIRLDEQTKIRYNILSPEIGVTYREEIEAVTQDISVSGVCFDTKEFLAPGILLRMEIELPLMDRPIQALSKVIWQQRDGDKNKTGAAFFWIPKEDREAISKYVE